MRPRGIKKRLIFFFIFLLGFLLTGCLGRVIEEDKESRFEKIDPYGEWQEFEQDWGLGWGKIKIKYPPDWIRIERAGWRETIFLGFSPEKGDEYYLREPMVRFLVEENPSLIKACDFESESIQGSEVTGEKEEEFSGRVICEKEIEVGRARRVVTLMPYGKKMVIFVFEKVKGVVDNSEFLDDFQKMVRSFVLE